MRIFISFIWGFAVWIVTAIASANYAESFYNARVASGSDPTFGDIGVTWLVATAYVGFFAFAMGLFGRLPGTKSNKTLPQHGNEDS